jgi:RNA polymerase sigma-70 factor, ECF subfamily
VCGRDNRRGKKSYTAEGSFSREERSDRTMQREAYALRATTPATRSNRMVTRPTVRLAARISRGKGSGTRAEAKPAVEGRQRKPDSSLFSETLRLAQQGDASAFEEIYRLHSRRVYSLCLRMLGNPVEAEDLAQEAFLQLFRKIHTFRGESAFSSWLHRLTANVVLMSFRKKKAVVASLDEMTPINDEDSVPRWEIASLDMRLVGVFDRVNLQTALEQLPEGYKRMFLLHDVHGYEHNEIAKILHCSVGNSKSQLHKARKRLRELLHRLKDRRPGTAARMASDSFAVAV